MTPEPGIELHPFLTPVHVICTPEPLIRRASVTRGLLTLPVCK